MLDLIWFSKMLHIIFLHCVFSNVNTPASPGAISLGNGSWIIPCCRYHVGSINFRLPWFDRPITHTRPTSIWLAIPFNKPIPADTADIIPTTEIDKRCFEKHCFCLSSSCVWWCPIYITVLCFLFRLSCIHYVASFSWLSILDCHFGFSSVYIVYEINGICSFSNCTREIKGLFKSYNTLEANEFIFISFHVLTYIFRQSKIDMCII